MHRRLACLITWLARSSTRDSEFNWLSPPSLSLCCYSWALSDNWRSTLIGLSVSSCLVRCSFSSGSLHTSLQCENKTHIYYFFIAYIFHHKWIITFHWFYYFRFQSRSALYHLTELVASYKYIKLNEKIKNLHLKWVAFPPNASSWFVIVRSRILGGLVSSPAPAHRSLQGLTETMT